MVDFGNRLKTLRLQKHQTQEQLARRLRLTKSVINAYENGLRMPSYEVLIAIAKLYNVPTDYLLWQENAQPLDLSGHTCAEIRALTELVKAMQAK